MNDFGSFLKAYRIKRRMTATHLSELTGISQSYLSNLERNKRQVSKIETVNRLSKALKVPASEIMLRAGLIED